MTERVNHRSRDELLVLALIIAGLVIVLETVVLGLFLDNNGLPNWAENVLVAIATASALKLGDAIAALVSLATGRQVESFGVRLADSTPAKKPPATPAPDATEAATRVAEAATDEAEAIAGDAAEDDEEAEINGATPK